jgi:DNA ligase-associated metallophosphoesterase
MPLLARPAGQRARPRRRAQRAALPFSLVGDAVETRVAGALVTAMPEGALWIADACALVVSDLHLEKGSAFAVHGQMLPPYDTHAALIKLSALLERLAPDIVVSLGDSFHDGGGPVRMAGEDRALLERMIARCDWIWVEGNHDGKSPETLGGAVRDVLRLGPLVLRHVPTEGAAPGEIAGHLHPCARVAGRGRSVRRRCFATDGGRIVMPAFGAFAGGLNVCDDAYAPIFPEGACALVLGRDRVHPVQAERLLAD